MFDKLDRFFLNIHQKILNVLQVEPRDAARNALLMYFLLRAIVQNFIGWGSWADVLSFGILMVVLAVMYLAPELHKTIAADLFARKITVFFAFFGWFLNIPIMFQHAPKGVAGFLSNFAYLAMFYFAACESPPPKKKTQHTFTPAFEGNL